MLEPADRWAVDCMDAVLFVGEVTGHDETASYSQQYAELVRLGLVSRSKPHCTSQLRPLQHATYHHVM